MAIQLKITLTFLMTTALGFGFMHHFFPGITYNFERLHVFLFNLCSGGTILLYFTEKQKIISGRTLAFLILSIAYAIFAFLKLYIPAMIISIALVVIVELVRIKEFSFLPLYIFKKDVPVSRKFHIASLVCLSSALVLSCLVILNNEYIKLISMPKLKLDTFFLGFSFPISLISMSVIFSFMKKESGNLVRALKELDFWTINLGVVIFFLFIIFEKLTPQVFVTAILFIGVVVIFILYYKLGEVQQQKNFLTSGIYFLLITAITGIAYIIFEFSQDYTAENYKWLLKLHSFSSLYGWNLCGLAVICRFDDFPIKLHSRGVIMLHWITAVLLAPLGIYYSPIAVFALISYLIILIVIIFSRKDH